MQNMISLGFITEERKEGNSRKKKKDATQQFILLERKLVTIESKGNGESIKKRKKRKSFLYH